MTTFELIEKLKELDPDGDMEARITSEGQWGSIWEVKVDTVDDAVVMGLD